MERPALESLDAVHRSDPPPAVAYRRFQIDENLHVEVDSRRGSYPKYLSHPRACFKYLSRPSRSPQKSHHALKREERAQVQAELISHVEFALNSTEC